VRIREEIISAKETLPEKLVGFMISSLYLKTWIFAESCVLTYFSKIQTKNLNK
jgi:hypothetical protein